MDIWRWRMPSAWVRADKIYFFIIWLTKAFAIGMASHGFIYKTYLQHGNNIYKKSTYTRPLARAGPKKSLPHLAHSFHYASPSITCQSIAHCSFFCETRPRTEQNKDSSGFCAHNTDSYSSSHLCWTSIQNPQQTNPVLKPWRNFDSSTFQVL